MNRGAPAQWDLPADWKLNESFDALGAPRRPALLVTDMQQDFINTLGSIINPSQQLVNWFRGRCHPIVFKLWALGGNETAMQRLMVRRFTDATRQSLACAPKIPIRGLGPITLTEANRTVKSWRYDLFGDIQTTSLLRAMGVNTVVIIGGFTEHCIAATAFGAFDHNFDVVVATDAVGPSAERGGLRIPALQTLEASVAKLATAAELMIAWNKMGRGSVCAETPTAIPDHGDLVHSFCVTGATHANRWPHWSPPEARQYVHARKLHSTFQGRL